MPRVIKSSKKLVAMQNRKSFSSQHSFILTSISQHVSFKLIWEPTNAKEYRNGHGLHFHVRNSIQCTYNIPTERDGFAHPLDIDTTRNNSVLVVCNGMFDVCVCCTKETPVDRVIQQ